MIQLQLFRSNCNLYNFVIRKGKDLRPYCKLTLDGTSEDHPVITTVVTREMDLTTNSDFLLQASETAYPCWDPQTSYSFMVEFQGFSLHDANLMHPSGF